MSTSNPPSLQLLVIFILLSYLLQPTLSHDKSNPDEQKKHTSTSTSPGGSVAGNGDISVKVSLQGSFSQVLAFGDSYTDTGNCIFLSGIKKLIGGKLPLSPYGSVFKSGLYGNRFCNGRLVVDFLCDALGLPPLPPFKDPKVNVSFGVNFAVSGSTSLTSDLFSKYKIGQGLLWKTMVPQNFLTQLDWFDEFLEKMVASGQVSGSASGKVSGGGSVAGHSGGSFGGGGSIGGGASGSGSFDGGASGGGSVGGGTSGGGSVGGGTSGVGSVGGGASGVGSVGGGASGGGSVGGGASGSGSFDGSASGGGSIAGGASGGGGVGGVGSSSGGASGGGSIGGGASGSGQVGGGGSGSASGSGQASGSMSGQASGSSSGSDQVSGSVSGKASGTFSIDFSNVLFWIGEMGVNDYARIISTTNLSGNWLSQLCVNHVTKILKQVLDKGAKYIVVQGLPPIGCLPLPLAFTPDFIQDKNGCSETINTLVRFHNELLQKKITELQAEYKHSVISYADYYGAYMSIMTNASVYHIQEPLKACCGANVGPFNFSPKFLCGLGISTKCSDPSKYIVWDGLHLTETMHKHLADLFFNKGYCKPSIHELIAKKSNSA